MSLFEELKRRNVVRMAVLYTVASWLFLQIADVLFDQLEAPAWAFRLVLGLLALGFPFALIFSWVFELTPEGLKRERDVDRNQSITQETGRKLNITIIVLLVLAIGGLIADRLIPKNASTPGTAGMKAGNSISESAAAGEDLSIAVLPFVNMSGDPDNEYFSDGLSEELLNTLVQIRALKVTGRTSSFAFKGQNLDLRQVGEKLNVANVLEGSVRKAANRVRITAQLVKTADGYHLWSETFDRELDDIFAIQQEIAEKVAGALSVTLLGKSSVNAGETQNTEAYQAYLRGMHIFRRAPDDLDSLQAARGFYEQALALDPDYISPLYGMFQYWDRMNRNGNLDFAVSAANMKSYADLLTQLAPESAEAMLAQARAARVFRDESRARELLEKTLELYPGNAYASVEYGMSLYWSGQAERGLATMKAGVDLDPLNLESLARLGNIESQLGKCADVQSLAEKALELEPGYGRVRAYLAYCFLIRGDDPEKALRWLEQEPVGFLRRTGEAIALHRLDRQEEAKQRMEMMMGEYGESASYQYAQVYAQWGENEKALDWLQTALEVHDPGIINSEVDHMLDPLHREPRFAELVRRAGWAECCDETE